MKKSSVNCVEIYFIWRTLFMQQNPEVLLLYSVCLYDTQVLNKYAYEGSYYAKDKQDQPGVVLVKNKS